jgi:microcin C transport system ATP-binding protein
MVGLPQFKDRLQAYPHELSGGQRQRVMIALALANDPELLIADEPTTALDVTVQKQILTLLKRLQQKTGLAIWLITHDLTIVRRVADRVVVMQNGHVVETQTTQNLFQNPQHPYTQKLLDSEPKGKPVPLPSKAKMLLDANEITVSFSLTKNFFGTPTSWVHAVKNASFSLKTGETLGIVGESGSGKTTLAMAILRLVKSTGNIQFDEHQLTGMASNEMRPIRALMQIVFQDPFASLNPRMTVGQIIAEGLQAHHIGKDSKTQDEMVCSALRDVELDPIIRSRYPHEFSGGQRQRIAIARAIILSPKLVVLDEPTSALDLTVQAQIITLLKKLQRERSISYLFISHDLRAIRAISHRIVVMKNGEIVEEGQNQDIFNTPKRSYTKALIEAAFPEESVIKKKHTKQPLAKMVKNR